MTEMSRMFLAAPKSMSNLVLASAASEERATLPSTLFWILARGSVADHEPPDSVALSMRLGKPIMQLPIISPRV